MDRERYAWMKDGRHCKPKPSKATFKVKNAKGKDILQRLKITTNNGDLGAMSSYVRNNTAVVLL